MIILYITSCYSIVKDDKMKTKIIITGEKVHEVGYRFFLADSANAYGIYNFRAYNTTVNDLQAVVVMAEGEEEDVKSYLEFVKENFPEHASVNEVNVEEYKGYIPTIDSFLLTFMAGQLNKGVPAILRIDEKQDKMLQKQDAMLGKQDAMLEKQDAMLQKQDETIAVIREESHKTRETITEHMKNDIAGIRAEIAEIKEKIAG